MTSPLRTSSVAFTLSLALGAGSAAAAPTVTIFRDAGVDTATALRIEKIIKAKRTPRTLRPLPSKTQSPQQVANKERIAAIERALERAGDHEAKAEWDACAKEAGDNLGVATEVLTTSDDLSKFRALHIQIGMCMALVPNPEDAKPHFRVAALLDETPLKKGLRRLVAEQLYDDTRAKVVSRKRGAVQIDTDPPGAEVWIDGHKAKGVTPLSVDIRLGNHFVTLRRFRYEPQTNHSLLHPKSKVRYVLSPARVGTLRHQLGRLHAGELIVSSHEQRLAHALWSKADQMIALSKPPGPSTSVKMSIFDSTTGQLLKDKTLASSLSEDGMLQGVCGALGERCAIAEPLLPWWAWTIIGAAVVGGTVGIAIWADSERDVRFCPPKGCQ